MPITTDNLTLKSSNDSIRLIKLRASRLILSLAPDWKQRNIIASILNAFLFAVLDFLKTLADENWNGNLQEAAQTAVTAIESAMPDASEFWGTVSAIRAHSNALEAAVLAGETVNIPQGTSDTITEGWPAD